MSIVYEVNLEVSQEIAQPFESWLNDHILQMLKIDGFEGATLYNEIKEPTNCHWCVQYLVESQAKLDDYFANHAQHMRQDGIDRFGDSMKATRRILQRRGIHD